MKKFGNSIVYIILICISIYIGYVCYSVWEYSKKEVSIEVMDPDYQDYEDGEWDERIFTIEELAD